ncbi:uncharacterized protein LOC105686327 [Athalia rosae]|uniref:uncharacterized protein LOC105686327 n=1 Tax=Athalia rosae TaxID=37344 RepID=UPI0020346009|nr:uncharacterized protein LOC105686327 [Athalia rosae]XP_048515883.1 uncharacterized protein LOC105686327 [Athalia rosae]
MYNVHRRITMHGSITLGEKRFVWDEVNNCLNLLGAPKRESEQLGKGHRKRIQNFHKSEVYCPHSYLELTFAETLDLRDKIKFRRNFLRKVTPTEPNIIILQDIKDLVMFLVVNPISVEFINFFHEAMVDRFLRSLIIYFQYYIEIWEDLCQKRAATAKKAPNPGASGSRSRQADEMHTLRTLVGKEYCDILIGAKNTLPYHHMVANKKSSSDEPSGQSQGEKDLRIYETLIRMAHKVVWIALQRKYSGLIEIEMHRLFRTDSFNTAKRTCGSLMMEDMPEDEVRVLQGEPIPAKRKLLRNSPLPYQIINRNCDYRALSIGIPNFETNDPRIKYLEKALLADEEKLQEVGIKIGILGQPRTDYDLMLMRRSSEEDNSDEQTGVDIEKERWEKRDSEGIQRKIQLHEETEIKAMPECGDDPELIAEYPLEPGLVECGGSQAAREEACKKWVARALKHSSNNHTDTVSIESGD